MKLREVKVYFERRDVWVGVYWDYSVLGRANDCWPDEYGARKLMIYICLIPFLPIRFRFQDKIHTERKP